MTQHSDEPGRREIDVRNSQGVYIGDHGRVFNLWRDPQTRALIIAGILITVFGLFLSTMLLWPEGPHVGLAVAAVEVTEPSKLDADIYTDTGEARGPSKSGSIDATVVDITLKNNGTAPALITGVKVDILFAEQLEDCTGGSGGPVVVSASYSVKLPKPLPAVPFSTTRDLRFEVGPGTVDRMALGIGPEEQNLSNPRPFVFAAHISFLHDKSDSQLDAGTVAMLTTSGKGDLQIAHAWDTACVERMSKKLETLYEIQATRSAELDRLHRKYQELMTPDPAPAQTKCQEWPGTSITKLCGRYRREELVITATAGEPLVVDDSLLLVHVDAGSSKNYVVYARHCTNTYDEQVWSAPDRLESDARTAWNSCSAANTPLLKVDEATGTVIFTMALSVDFSATGVTLSAEIQHRPGGGSSPAADGVPDRTVAVERGN